MNCSGHRIRGQKTPTAFTYVGGFLESLEPKVRGGGNWLTFPALTALISPGSIFQPLSDHLSVPLLGCAEAPGLCLGVPPQG